MEGPTAVQPRATKKSPEVQTPNAGDLDLEKADEPETASKHTFLISFDESQDGENPKNWSTTKKWAITSVLSATGFNRILVSTIIAPALSRIAVDLNMNRAESVMSMSVYLLATAFGPLVIGPLSEIYGRKPVLHATNVWFLLWNLVCGFSHNKGVLIAARLLAGFGAGAVYVLAGGVLGDVWRPGQRGKSLGFYILVPLLAVAIGPVVGGLIAQSTTWRWSFWSTSIVQLLLTVFSIVIMDETYASIILQRKAVRVRKETGDHRFHTASEKLSEGRPTLWVLQRGLSRPIRLLVFHPIIQLQACLSAFYYGLLYLVISTYADLWTSKYGESVAASGLHYIALSIGEVAGAALGGPLMDIVFRKLKARTNGTEAPEYHMPLMLPTAIAISVGLLLYGWTAQAQIPWPVVDVSVAVFSCGMQISGMALQAYVIDAYPDNTSSAQAAAQFPRSLAAFGFPLFGPSMYEALGYGWANTLLAIIAFLVSVTAPIFIWMYGSRLRAKARASF